MAMGIWTMGYNPPCVFHSASSQSIHESIACEENGTRCPESIPRPHTSTDRQKPMVRYGRVWIAVTRRWYLARLASPHAGSQRKSWMEEWEHDCHACHWWHMSHILPLLGAE